MEKEYIEREAARDYINNGNGTPLQKLFADLCVLNTPAADVEKVRHGKWVPYEQPLGVGYSIPNYKPTHYCSLCKGLGWEFYTGCPHCNAKMDEKDGRKG